MNENDQADRYFGQLTQPWPLYIYITFKMGNPIEKTKKSGGGERKI